MASAAAARPWMDMDTFPPSAARSLFTVMIIIDFRSFLRRSSAYSGENDFSAAAVSEFSFPIGGGAGA